MKKSSLIAVALASLVGLVACNKPAAKSKTETAIAVYMEKFYLDNFEDPKGDPYEMKASRGETTDDIFENAKIIRGSVIKEEIVESDSSLVILGDVKSKASVKAK